MHRKNPLGSRQQARFQNSVIHAEDFVMYKFCIMKVFSVLLLLFLVVQGQENFQSEVQQETEQVESSLGLGALVGGPPLPEVRQPTWPCDRFDEFVQKNYPNWFLLLRLINLYTQDDPVAPGPALNLTAFGGPVTVLAPTASAEFLLQNDINMQELVKQPLASILLAPSMANHFVLGYHENVIPPQPQTACGSSCTPLSVQTINDQSTVSNTDFGVNVVKRNVANCPGQWVVHEVDSILFNPVESGINATQSALVLANGLGGLFDTFNLVGGN